MGRCPLQSERDVGPRSGVFERGGNGDGENRGVSGRLAVGDVVHQTYGDTAEV